MNLDARFEHALQDGEPVDRLHELAIALRDEGQDRDDLLSLFDSQRMRLSDSGRERDEDAVLDVMDFIVGWCSPQKKVYPEGVDLSKSFHE